MSFSLSTFQNLPEHARIGIVTRLALITVGSGAGIVLSLQLTAITAYVLYKAQLRVKCIFACLVASSILLVASMVMMVHYSTTLIVSDPSRVFAASRIGTAIGFFLSMDSGSAAIKNCRPLYWAITSCDQAVCTVLLGWKLGRAAWGTLEAGRSRRAAQIVRALRWVAVISNFTGFVPTCLAGAIAIQLWVREANGNYHNGRAVRFCIFTYSWATLIGAQVAYLIMVVKMNKIRRDDTPFGWIADRDVAHDARQPSLRRRWLFRRHCHVTDGQNDARSKVIDHASQDLPLDPLDGAGKGLVIAPDGAEDHYTQSKRRWPALQSLLHQAKQPKSPDNSGRARTAERLAKAAVLAKKREAHGGWDSRVYSEPHLNFPLADPEGPDVQLSMMQQYCVVATIGCPMDLEIKEKFQGDTITNHGNLEAGRSEQQSSLHNSPSRCQQLSPSANISEDSLELGSLAVPSPPVAAHIHSKH
ncbi:unnamed protein product [Sympodiomycopsis kandeliae]